VEALKNLTPSPSPCKGEGNKKKLWLPFSLQGEGVGGCGAFSFHVTSVTILSVFIVFFTTPKERKRKAPPFFIGT